MSLSLLLFYGCNQFLPTPDFTFWWFGDDHNATELRPGFGTGFSLNFFHLKSRILASLENVFQDCVVINKQKVLYFALRYCRQGPFLVFYHIKIYFYVIYKIISDNKRRKLTE